MSEHSFFPLVASRTESMAVHIFVGPSFSIRPGKEILKQAQLADLDMVRSPIDSIKDVFPSA